MNLSLDDWGDLASIIAAAVAVGALLYTAVQVRISTKVSRAQFWLEVRKMFSDHREVHLKLRNQEWSKNPPTDEDWAKLEAYMGLFEHCEMMLEEGLLDWKTFKAIYGYRLLNLLDDRLIVREKLIDRRGGWTVFIQLLERMNSELPKRRYLSGYWDPDTKQWKLWWGFADHQEGIAKYNSFEDLKTNYEAKLDELGRREDGLAYSWLMSKTGEVVSSWPSPQTREPPVK